MGNTKSTYYTSVVLTLETFNDFWEKHLNKKIYEAGGSKTDSFACNIHETISKNSLDDWTIGTSSIGKYNIEITKKQLSNTEFKLTVTIDYVDKLTGLSWFS